MIVVFAANADDFSTNGYGPIDPISATVRETLNGMYELTVVHPLDEAGKWRRLMRGNILRAPVPAATTPAFTMKTSAETVEIYRINGGRVRLRSGPSTSHKRIKTYDLNTEVIVLSKANPDWYEVTMPDGKRGYMRSTYLTFVRSETTGTASETVIEARTLRDQPFRIYDVEPGIDRMTVHARHIFYDLADNAITEYKPKKQTGATVAQQILEKCTAPHEFSIFSNVTRIRSAEWQQANPIEAFFGDGGLAEVWGCEFVRDWYDIFAMKKIGKNRQVHIRYGKNLTAIGGSESEDNVVTRIIPVGEDKKGKPLYLPEKHIDSEHIGLYPHPRIAFLPVSDAKEDDKTSKEACYTLMRDAAADEYENGADLPDLTLTVDFVNLANTAEYASFQALRELYLGDTATITHDPMDIKIGLRLTEYEYDCLSEKYTRLTLGTPDTSIATTGISPKQLPNGKINGGKLSYGSVGSGHMQDGSVNADHIQAGSINADHIQAGTINAGHIQAGSITTEHIQAGTVDADLIQADAINAGHIQSGSIESDHITAGAINAGHVQADSIGAGHLQADSVNAGHIQAGSIGTGHLQAGSVTTDKLDATTVNAHFADIANAEIGQAEIGTAQIANAQINWAQIQGLTANTALFYEGVGDKLFVDDLAVTDANIIELSASKITAGMLTVGTLILKGPDGKYYELTIEDGELKMAREYVEGDNIADDTITADKILAGTITARTLNVSEIFASSLLVNAIKAANIDVSSLFASTAFTGALHTNIINSDVGAALDISSNDAIRLMAVGSRNYVPKSDFAVDQTAYWSTAGSTSLSHEASGSFAGSMGFTIPANATGGRGMQTPLITGILEREGEEVTLSFRARCSLGGELSIDYIWVITNDGSGNIKIPVTFGPVWWSKATNPYKVTFKAPRNLTGGIRILIGTSQSAATAAVMYISDVQLEKGNKATDWRPAPNEFYAGSSVVLTPEQIKLRSLTTSIEVPGSGADESMLLVDGDGVTAKAVAAGIVSADNIDSPSVVSVYRGPYTLTVDKGATPNESTGVFRTIQAALDYVNFKAHDRNVTINITSGQSFSEQVRLRDTSGVGRILIQTSSTGVATIRGSMRVEACSGAMQVSNIAFRSTFTSGSSNGMLRAFRSGFVQVVDCTFNGNDFTAYGILAEYGSTALITDCSFYRCGAAMRAQPGCTISAYNTIGNNLTHAFYCLQGIILASGTIPDGNTYVGRNGILNIPSTGQTSGTTPPAPTDPEPTTVTYSCRLSSWYQTNAWSSETQVRQGYTAPGEFRGGMWFPSLSALSGKTIESVQLRLHRKAGYGRSSAVGVVLRGITNTGKSGAPAFASGANYGTIGTIAPGATKTFDLPTSVVTHLVNGTTGGLALYANDGALIPGRTYSDNYAVFYGTEGTSSTEPQLIVTYY